MLTPPCTRRRFIASTSLIMAAAAIPAAGFNWPDRQGLAIFVSAEHASPFDLARRAIRLEGPRIARLQMMADSLPKLAGEIILRLDATDDHLLDVAAQQAGMSIRRGTALADGLGIHAHVVTQQRNFA